MRATDLDDILPRIGLCRQSILERPDGRKESLGGDLRRRNMHGRRKCVVGRLRHIHVIVGMNGILAAELAARHLDRAIGDHLVDVHIRLRAAAGLPHAQRKVIVEVPRDHFLRRLDDEIRPPFVKPAEIVVRQRRGLLDRSEGMHDLDRNAIVADREVLERALRLRAPVAVGGDLDLTQTVRLYAPDRHTTSS